MVKLKKVFEEDSQQTDLLGSFIDDISYSEIVINDAKAIRIDRKGRELGVFLKEVADKLDNIKTNLANCVKDLNGRWSNFEIENDYEVGSFIPDEDVEALLENVLDPNEFLISVFFRNSQGENIISFINDQFDLVNPLVDSDVGGGDAKIEGTCTLSFSLLVDDYSDRFSSKDLKHLEEDFSELLERVYNIDFWFEEIYNIDPDDYDWYY